VTLVEAATVGIGGAIIVLVLSYLVTRVTKIRRVPASTPRVTREVATRSAHPNGPSEVHSHVTDSALALSASERQEAIEEIDLAVARLHC
jgi:hypothetical protein